MPRTRSKKQNVRLSVTLDEYVALAWLGEELDLLVAWMIRRAVSEFVARHREGIAADLPLRHPEAKSAAGKKSGGSHGQ